MRVWFFVGSVLEQFTSDSCTCCWTGKPLLLDSLYFPRMRPQPLAQRFGDACSIDAAYIANFGEEVVRGQPLFVLSVLLKQLEPSLRAAAGVGAWQVPRLRLYNNH